MLPKVNSIKCFSTTVSLVFPSDLFCVWEICQSIELSGHLNFIVPFIELLGDSTC